MKFNVLEWNECDQEFKMVVKQGNNICTQLVGDDGEELFLCEVHKGTCGWVVGYTKQNRFKDGKQ